MKRKIGNLFKGDKVVWMVFFMLCMISIVEVFSASSNLTYGSNNYIMPIIKHSMTIFLGLFVAILTLNVPCRYFKLFTPILICLSFFTLLWVLFAGETINGANRVVGLGALTFQPSEIAKGTMVLASAQILSAMQNEHGTTDKNAFRFILILLIPMSILIGKENLSTAALLCLVIYLMMILGQKNDVEKVESQPMKLQRFGTWKKRIKKFLDNKPIAPKDYDLDKDAQVAHANIAIVSSNIIGKGPGNSVERDFLSQAFSDFIYAIIIEEMGIVGATIVVFLYIVLLFRAARIANRCENNFPAFLVMGLALLLVIQAVFNMMVAVGLVPVTGQPLPLISKGGTSTVINCVYIGMILSISRSAKRKTKELAADDYNQEMVMKNAPKSSIISSI